MVKLKKENISIAIVKLLKKAKGKKLKKDLSKVECYSCHQKGHYKNKCPQKEQVATVMDQEAWPKDKELKKIILEHEKMFWIMCYNNIYDIYLFKK